MGGDAGVAPPEAGAALRLGRVTHLQPTVLLVRTDYWRQRHAGTLLDCFRCIFAAVARGLDIRSGDSETATGAERDRCVLVLPAVCSDGIAVVHRGGSTRLELLRADSRDQSHPHHAVRPLQLYERYMVDSGGGDDICRGISGRARD